ncbi:MAG TPA: hypothetical protein VLB01_07690 [Thermodesulfobacteriota bacterium]|nr:hypothetical protein [Thermodesulfobacteriota bacterium]
MLAREERKGFVEPILVKCEDSLDKVTMQVYGGGGGGATSSSSGGDNCDWFEDLFNLNGCN